MYTGYLHVPELKMVKYFIGEQKKWKQNILGGAL